MKVTECIPCPKCSKVMLKQDKSNYTLWFCHGCKAHFSTDELVHEWGLDAGDLFGNIDSVPRSGASVKKFHSEFDGGEPYWVSIGERVNAYQMVQRMFDGVEEIDDHIDLMNTMEDALQIGVQ